MILYHRFCFIYDIKLFLYLSIPFLLCENFLFFHGISYFLLLLFLIKRLLFKYLLYF